MARRLAFAFALQFLAVSAFAADYPARPIKLVVPYAPGGGADSVARIVAKKVSENIGQPIVIENKGGAGSILGTDMVAKAEPDGYTLLLGQSGPISINPAVYKTLPYDPVKDFAPITMTTAYPYILVVNADSPAKTLQEFVKLAKDKPGSMNYGSTGVGAANHLVSELFNSKAGLKMTHVPYRGTALAVGDLLSGQLSMVWGDPISVLGHIKSGKLRALAVTSSGRSPVAPDVPTVAESGYPGFEALAWHGILAPAKTPPSIVEKLNAEIVKALADPATKKLLTDQAMATVGNTPPEFAAFIQKDILLWKGVAQAANVTVE
ncbi:MAG: tripartite tricarboxylate transporter substrate binding protein [Proteobacteria bacterium]|nr:tripartite tricarboxylate transporter substrate binding protein [Pseudomonadota bacterium]MBS0548253.1 tripartite tricarboxylate transporter substrate binding protein [Pseudomonadota bacterium]